MSVTRKSRGAVLAALTSLAISACASPSAGQESSDRWWSNPEIVTAVIVGYLDIRSKNEEVARNAAFGSDVVNLLLLFDGWDDAKSRETLASLTSYYLGSHGGETYSCVVVRQGRAILPDLEKQIAAKATDCQDRLGDKPGVCAPEKSRSSKLRTLIARIESGASCELER